MNEDSINYLLDFNRLIHEPARLLIMAILYLWKEADFLFLLDATNLTKGNLGSHIVVLENEHYVEVEKRFVGKIPMTVLRLTPEGRAAFKEYQAAMKKAWCD